MKVYLERQDDLAVCQLDPSHKWFWTSCWKGTQELIGMDLEPDEAVSFDLRADNVKRLGRRVLTRRRQRMNYLFGSKKSTQMGLPLAFFSAVIGYFVWKQGVPAELIGDYFIMMGLVVLGHMIAYGMSDAAAGKPK